ncbi:MAG: ATPase, T2SS/T4P/T4SS family [Granulosicoccus sp.]
MQSNSSTRFAEAETVTGVMNSAEGLTSQSAVGRFVADMLVRERYVAEEAIDRSERILEKLGGKSTLFQVLEKLGQITESNLLECIRKNQPDLPVGVLLVELGLITTVQLQQALKIQKESGVTRKIGEIMVYNRMLRDLDLTRVLASQLGVNSEEPGIEDCDRNLLDTIQLKSCKALAYLPIRRDGNQTVVAFVDTMNQQSRTEAARSLGTGIKPVMASLSTINAALDTLQDCRKPLAADKSGAADGGSVSVRVNEILVSALSESASDIHIEPLSCTVRVRFRIDGVLSEHCQFPRDEMLSLVSRLKVMADADIVERRRHQNGRIAFENPKTGQHYNIRASFYVTVHGECVVLRIQSLNRHVVAIGNIGMASPALKLFKQHALNALSGMTVIAGPNGCGKTTTLYSCIDFLNDESTSIVTTEDPVEFTIDGISQCAIDLDVDRTFDDSLRQIARQDPDIIVIGELKDLASTKAACQSALTGSRVLTTLQASDCIGALLGLMSMGVKPFQVSSAVVSVVAQRLLRRICVNCAEPVNVEASELQLLGFSLEDLNGAEFKTGTGCASCHFTGYSGKVAVFETLMLTDEVREAIIQRKTPEQIRRICIDSAGMVTLLEGGLTRVLRGETTLSEIQRTLSRQSKPLSAVELHRLTGENHE